MNKTCVIDDPQSADSAICLNSYDNRQLADVDKRAEYKSYDKCPAEQIVSMHI
ncbi:MAG: hypothetical protein ACOC4C_03985 [Fibrobacterota bacterium]